MKSKKAKGYFYALGAVLIWSGFILVSRMGGISALTAYDIIAIRYVSSTVFILPFWLFWKRFNMFQPKLIIISLIGGLAYALCVFNGFKVTPASHASVLIPGLLPISIALISMVLNKERHSTVKWLGILLITFGIVVLFLNEFYLSNRLSIGHVLLVGAAICWATFSVLISRWHISPWRAIACLSVITCVLYTPVYLIFLPKNISVNMLPDIGIQVFYQGFLATIVQMLFYVRAVQLVGAANMGTMMAIVPILSGFAAIYIFNEAINLLLIFSFLCVSTGVLIANLKWKLGSLQLRKLSKA